MKKSPRSSFMASRRLVLLTSVFLVIGGYLFLVIGGYLFLGPTISPTPRLSIGRDSKESGSTRDEDSDRSTATVIKPEDILLGGLLSPDFHNQSCLSRYQTVLYRKASRYTPSSYLISKLRKYEELHKKCGPNTPLYKKYVEQLKINDKSTNESLCNYIIWTPVGGLGNRMLTLASTFLYALLTDRVLLINSAKFDFSNLFCEPFPNSTWVLPSSFPIKDFDTYNSSSESYGYLLKNKLIEEDPNVRASSLPAFVYVHLVLWDTYIEHQLFFCTDNQVVINKINWLLVKSDNYFLPGLFILTQYKLELARMFPLEKTVFHHLGRYLFHPTNSVWEIATKFYDSHIANHDEIVGIQVRDFVWSKMSRDYRFNQIMNCSLRYNILPDLLASREVTSSKAVLVASLYKEYFDKMKTYYEGSPYVSVYQPTHEESQQLENHAHNEKALAEIFLLSFCDKLVTSAWSTFGYVGYSLAGIKPWILLSSKVSPEVNPSCREVLTIDPCFHLPPLINCKTKISSNTSFSLGPLLRQCEDVDEGIKLIK